MIRRPPRSTLDRSSAASDVYKRQDYNTATPLKATYVDTLALAGTAKLVGLAYAQGKLVGSASRNSGTCTNYDFNILTGGLSPLTSGAGVQYSADMTNI